MNRMNRSGGAICAAVLAVSLLAAGGHVNADERPVSWDNGGPSQLWTETNNWNPNTVGGPANVGILEYLVTIGCSGVHGPVIFDDTSKLVEITDFLLCDDLRFVLDSGTNLAILRTTDIAGIIDGRGGNFTAPQDPNFGTAAFIGNRARIFASDGSVIQIGAPMYSSAGLASTTTILSADGEDTKINLPGLTSLSTAFNDGWSGVQGHTITATNGAEIDLSALLAIDPPARGEDFVRFAVSGSGSVLDMSALGTINSATSGRVLVDIADGGHVKMGSLQACNSVTITLNSPTDRFEVNDLIIGSNVTITAPAGGTISVGGDFLYTHENTADLSLGLATAECVGDLQQLEVGGMDRDVEWQLIPDDNFGYEQLIIGQAGYASRVELVDLHDNLEPGLADALYLWGDEVSGKRGLRILGESTLVIGDLNVYALLDLNQPGVMEKIRIRDLFPAGQTVIPFDKGFISLEVPPHLGDMNCDGVFNGADIDPFFLALGDPAAYAAQFPKCNILNGDMNRDGTLNGGDIDPFFARLGGASCP